MNKNMSILIFKINSETLIQKILISISVISITYNNTTWHKYNTRKKYWYLYQTILSNIKQVHFSKYLNFVAKGEFCCKQIMYS